jgi:glycosyltransferase involved in cell wall biosynthesis
MSAVPRLSIGLPVYNGEDFLAESLDALLGQSYEDFELIISDNASTDGTAGICRRYAAQDSRVRYVRQLRNIGAVPNHNFVFGQSRGELFKWASDDDLYARDLLQRCVDALDEYPDVVLAHSWTGAVDAAGKVTQALEDPLATDSPRAAERFRSMLFAGCQDDYGLIRADDAYGVIRAEVLRRVGPQDSYYRADRVFATTIALHGRFHQERDWLYFRRDHPARASSAKTVGAWCVALDPRRANRLRHPTIRLVGEYMWGYAAAIHRAPLSPADRRECYCHLARWVAGRAVPAAGKIVRRGNIRAGEPVPVPPPPASLLIDAIVAGRERRPA